MEQGKRIPDLQKGCIAMKKDIRQEPEYQELVNLLQGMSEDRRAVLGQALDDMDRADITRYMTTEQAGAQLQINPATVRLWLRTGRLKGRRFGGRWRVSISDVERMLADDGSRQD